MIKSFPVLADDNLNEQIYWLKCWGLKLEADVHYDTIKMAEKKEQKERGKSYNGSNVHFWSYVILSLKDFCFFFSSVNPTPSSQLGLLLCWFLIWLLVVFLQVYTKEKKKSLRCVHISLLFLSFLIFFNKNLFLCTTFWHLDHVFPSPNPPSCSSLPYLPFFVSLPHSLSIRPFQKQTMKVKIETGELG